jgi:hypothetical protein
MVIVKRLDATANWYVYHRSPGPTQRLLLESTGGASTSTIPWNNTAPTDTVFTVTADGNTSGGTYVAYLFAHDTAADGMVQCGSYTGNGSASGPTITLGWEPQFVIIKRVAGTSDWFMMDSQRSGMDAYFRANTADAESSNTFVNTSSTGFSLTTANATLNASGESFIYLAIRAPV